MRCIHPTYTDTGKTRKEPCTTVPCGHIERPLMKCDHCGEVFTCIDLKRARGSFRDSVINK